MSFFGFLGKALGVVGSVVGGPVGLIARGISGSAGSASGGVASAAALPAASPFRAFGGGGPGFGGMMPTFSPGRALTAGGGPGAGSSLLPHFSCDRGFHHAKHKGALFGALASKCVRNRRMNVANPKALRRSIRRLYGAEKMYARLLKVTHPHKRGRVHPKPPRRRRS